MREGVQAELSSCVGGYSLRMIRRLLGQVVCPTRPCAHPLWRHQSLCQTALRTCPLRPAQHPARPLACSNGASGGVVIPVMRGRGGVPWAACSRSMRRSSLPGWLLLSAAPPAVAGCCEAFLDRCRGHVWSLVQFRDHAWPKCRAWPWVGEGSGVGFSSRKRV